MEAITSGCSDRQVWLVGIQGETTGCDEIDEIVGVYGSHEAANAAAVAAVADKAMWRWVEADISQWEVE